MRRATSSTRSLRASPPRDWMRRTCSARATSMPPRFWKQLSTIDGKAHLLGEYESLRGGWRNLFQAPERHAAVTRADIAVAAAPAAESAPAHGRHAAAARRGPMLSPHDASSPVRRIIEPEPHGLWRTGARAHACSANGMTLVMVPRRDVPLVAFQLLIRGGALGDPPGRRRRCEPHGGAAGQGRRAARCRSVRATVSKGAGGSFAATCRGREPQHQRPVPGAGPGADAGAAGAMRSSRRVSRAAEFARQRSGRSASCACSRIPTLSELLPQYGRGLLFGAASLWSAGQRQRGLAAGDHAEGCASSITARTSAPTGRCWWWPATSIVPG